MAKKKTEYTNESISMLKGADRVRLRPSVIFGSDGLEGCEHAFFEILSNSIDEAREGYGNIIEVKRYLDKSIEVTDMGRGIPLDFNAKENRYNWELVFTELYAGGKYNTNSGENYEYSLGLNGLGACATQYASEFMDVCVYRDGYKYELHFEKGINVGGLKKEECTYRHTKSQIRWLPDLDVFTDIDIPVEFYHDVLKKQAIVNKGILFKFKNEVTPSRFEETEYIYNDGILDYVKETASDKSLTSPVYYECEKKGRDRADKDDYKVKLSVAFCFSNQNVLLEYFHNSSFLEHGGSPDKAVTNAFVYAIDKYIKQTNKYAKNEAKITFGDVKDCLILVSNSFSTFTSYENQTKKAINNPFIAEAMTEFLRSELEFYFIENKVEAEKIANQVLVNKRSREHAEKSRVNIAKKLSGSIDVTNKIAKFVDCRTKDVTRRELYIVEGDSALGSCKMARDSEFQAIMPVRGKILNCLKASYDKIFKSEIIVDLLKVMGCGVEISTKSNKNVSEFDINNLRWDKIIICTDADVDGFQIRTLILAMLYRLTPTLIKEGKAYIAESPLFEITHKNETYFAYTEKEKSDIIKNFDGKYTIQRSKGLGENEPEMMSKTTMNPETRRLIKVTQEEAEETARVFDLLLGDDLSGRKDYITQYGKDYLDMLDLS
ncbi:MAG: DNA topoisomerase [Ruminococcaceae bacterium]|nr:DNA topoisomerase [Oscillospiraceae bacterium]